MTVLSCGIYHGYQFGLPQQEPAGPHHGLSGKAVGGGAVQPLPHPLVRHRLKDEEHVGGAAAGHPRHRV